MPPAGMTLMGGAPPGARGPSFYRSVPPVVRFRFLVSRHTRRVPTQDGAQTRDTSKNTYIDGMLWIRSFTSCEVCRARRCRACSLPSMSSAPIGLRLRRWRRHASLRLGCVGAVMQTATRTTCSVCAQVMTNVAESLYSAKLRSDCVRFAQYWLHKCLSAWVHYCSSKC